MVFTLQSSTFHGVYLSLLKNGLTSDARALSLRDLTAAGSMHVPCEIGVTNVNKQNIYNRPLRVTDLTQEMLLFFE